MWRTDAMYFLMNIIDLLEGFVSLIVIGSEG